MKDEYRKRSLPNSHIPRKKNKLNIQTEKLMTDLLEHTPISIQTAIEKGEKCPILST